MPLPRVLTNFNLYLDGVSMDGRVESVTLPTLTDATEEHRGGGMNAPVDIKVGQEKMTVTFTIAEYLAAALRRWGVNESTDISFRGALKQGSDVVELRVTMRGNIHEVDMGEAALGSKTQCQFNGTLRFYELILGGEEIFHIDVLGMKHRINGVDQLEAERRAIGL